MVELWPAWQHDPGYHVCIGCLRRAYQERYLADIRHMDRLVASQDRGEASEPQTRTGKASMSAAASMSVTAGMGTAAEMEAYFLGEIRRLTGPQLPAGDATGIFEQFIRRFGERDAWRIARAAVEVHKGYWRGAPVTLNRFRPGHDEFFARPVLALLDGQPEAA